MSIIFIFLFLFLLQFLFLILQTSKSIFREHKYLLKPAMFNCRKVDLEKIALYFFRDTRYEEKIVAKFFLFFTIFNCNWPADWNDNSTFSF